MSPRGILVLALVAEVLAVDALPRPQRLLAVRGTERAVKLSLLQDPDEDGEETGDKDQDEAPPSKEKDQGNPLKVAMLCPTLDPLIKANALDAESGWDLWLQLTGNSARLAGTDEKRGEKIKVQSTSLPFSKATFLKVAEKAGAGDYDLVVGCSTHHFKEVATAMQALKIPNLQCNAGNPNIWKGLAKIATADKEPLYGFGLHSPFTAYPMPYLRMAKKAFHARGVHDVKVGLVIGRETDFTKGLCNAATKAADSLNMKIYGGKLHRLEDVRRIAPSVDVLYACTMLPDGERLMSELREVESAKRPAAVSISIAPSKPSFVKLFGESALGVSYPGQWHHTAGFECDGNCSKGLDSTEEYLEANEALGLEGLPSYDRASCTAAGSALEAALASLPAGFQKMQRQKRREQLREALQKVDTDSFFGPIRFDKVSHMNVGRDPVIAQYQKSNSSKSGVEDVAVSDVDASDAVKVGRRLQLGATARKGATPKEKRPARAAAAAKTFGAVAAVALALGAF